MYGRLAATMCYGDDITSSHLTEHDVRVREAAVKDEYVVSSLCPQHLHEPCVSCVLPALDADEQVAPKHVDEETSQDRSHHLTEAMELYE